MMNDIRSHGLEEDCRHTAPSDDRFTARMRFHQSWYRRRVLGLPPGPNPAARGTVYGNMVQPALHGVLRRLYSLGLPLISVNCIEG